MSEPDAGNAVTPILPKRAAPIPPEPKPVEKA